MTSPGRISCLGSPQHCVQPTPEITISVWPRGWVCQLLRAPGSNVTSPPVTRLGSGFWNSGSTRTAPVKYSAGPLPDGFDPARVMLTISVLPFGLAAAVPELAGLAAAI